MWKVLGEFAGALVEVHVVDRDSGVRGELTGQLPGAVVERVWLERVEVQCAMERLLDRDGH